MKVSSALIALALLCCSFAHADTVTLSGFIGDTDISYQAQSIAPSQTVSYPLEANTVYIKVQEVYPDTTSQPKYDYELRAQGRLVFRRIHKGMAFGPVSYLVKIPAWASSASTIDVTNKGSVPVNIMRITRLDHTLMTGIESSDDFTLMGLVSFYGGTANAQNMVNDLAANIPTAPGISKGFSTELPYACWSSSSLQSMINSCLSWSVSKGMKFMPIMTSWWAGTPKVPDGEGGYFTDIKYQQICWSPNDTTDEGPELKALLRSRWDIRYCLSVPNQWSNTPWLTMNHPTLNNYKFQKLWSTMYTFANAAKNSSASVLGVCLENEPRYWDTGCEAGNPRRLGPMYADFNPCVVSDAAADGVTLNPWDGLTYSELNWLQRNVSRYNQKTADYAILGLIFANYSVPLYTHTLPGMDMFPGSLIAHSGSEFGYVHGARLGIEGAFNFSTCERLQEWGPWANVNYEEGITLDRKLDLWDLRVTYAAGARLFNSYNWETYDREDFFAYLNDFVSNLPSVQVTGASKYITGPRTMAFSTSPDVQGINRIRTTVQVSSQITDGLFILVRKNSDLIAAARAEGPFSPGTHTVDFYFWAPLDMPRNGSWNLEIQAEEPSLTSALTLTDATFHLDLRRERTQNLLLQTDTTAPTGGILINNGALYTNSREVTLNLSASDNQSAPSQMLSTNSTFGGAMWQAYTPLKAWTLTSGDGLKTVYVRYRDRAENVSPTYSATIRLDTVLPTKPSTPAGQGAYSSDDPITFTWGPSSDSGSGIKGYDCQIGRSPGANDLFDGHVGDTLSKSISVPPGTPCFCRVRAVDNAGNTSAWTASSPGTTRVSQVLTSITEAKVLSNDIAVGLSGKIVTAVFEDCIYIQELDRRAGIKVVPVDGIPPTLKAGDLIDVGGSIVPAPNGERYITGTISVGS